MRDELLSIEHLLAADDAGAVGLLQVRGSRVGVPAVSAHSHHTPFIQVDRQAARVDEVEGTPRKGSVMVRE